MLKYTPFWALFGHLGPTSASFGRFHVDQTRVQTKFMSDEMGVGFLQAHVHD